MAHGFRWLWLALACACAPAVFVSCGGSDTPPAAGGSGGTAGTPTAGSGGTGGTGGTGGGTGGTGGSSGASTDASAGSPGRPAVDGGSVPCGDAGVCPNGNGGNRQNTRFCDIANQRCVECLAESDCTGDLGGDIHCNIMTGRCRACVIGSTNPALGCAAGSVCTGNGACTPTSRRRRIRWTARP